MLGTIPQTIEKPDGARTRRDYLIDHFSRCILQCFHCRKSHKPQLEHTEGQCEYMRKFYLRGKQTDDDHVSSWHYQELRDIYKFLSGGFPVVEAVDAALAWRSETYA